MSLKTDVLVYINNNSSNQTTNDRAVIIDWYISSKFKRRFFLDLAPQILQVADLDLWFSHYKLDIDSYSEGITNPISDTLVVEDLDDISESITGMSKFFFGARLNPKRG